MNKGIVFAGAIVLTLGLGACGSTSQTGTEASSSASTSESASSSAKDESTTTAKDFDGSGCVDTGAGTMTLRTAGGTSENGNVPEVAVQSSTSLLQIEIDTDGMDGSACTVYVDGIENTTMNAGQRTQQTFSLQGDALKSGTHKVELVKTDGSTVSIYKSAEYKVQ